MLDEVILTDSTEGSVFMRLSIICGTKTGWRSTDWRSIPASRL